MLLSAIDMRSNSFLEFLRSDEYHMTRKLSVLKRAQAVIPIFALGLIPYLSLVAQSGPSYNIDFS